MIALDTNIFIYYLERNTQFFSAAENALKLALHDGPISVPTITIMEIMSGTSAKEVLDFFSSKQFTLHDFTYDLAVLAGKLRHENESLKAADAIHLATALANDARQFVTNDVRLMSLNLGLEVVPLQQLSDRLALDKA